MIKDGSNQITAADFVIVTTAGEALSARDACYISSADGKAYKCDADDEAKCDFEGFAGAAASLNAAVNIVGLGKMMTGFSGLTTGSMYYLSSTAGAITSTAPAIAVPVGKAVSTTVIAMQSRPVVAVRKFIANGTWTKRAGLLYVIAEAWGAGASGGRDSSSNAAGGGGGGYIRKRIEAASLGATETVTIGAGGAFVSTNAAGNAGGNTTFGSHITAYGGAAGAFGGAPSRGGGGGGTFGAPSGGTGGEGGGASSPATALATALYPTFSEGGGHGGSSDGSVSGPGGNAIYGGAGGGSRRQSGTQGAGGSSIYGGNGGTGGATGTNGTAPGGGGGGSSTGNSGAGAIGWSLVTEYYA